MKTQKRIQSWEITSESVYNLDRRRFLREAGLATAAGLAAMALPGQLMAEDGELKTVQGPFSTDEAPNSWEDITTYNNFYEFGTGKDDPHKNAQDFITRPWSVKDFRVSVTNPGYTILKTSLAPHTLEDRVYRHRCVEAWSMVVPWVGFPLGDLLKRFNPNSDAKFVRFKTLHDPEQMPGTTPAGVAMALC